MGEQGFNVSPSQGIALMSLAELIRTGDVIIRSGWDADEDYEASAASLLKDVAQEIALQVENGD